MELKFYPYKTGGGGAAQKVLAMLKGGGDKMFQGSFNSGACSFSHTEGGGVQKVSTIRGRGA